MAVQTSAESTPITLSIEWVHNRRICVFQPHSARASAVDIWFESVRETMMEWPISRPYRVIYDLSFNLALCFSPRVKLRMLQLFHMRPELRGRVAILMPAALASDEVPAFVKTQMGSLLTSRVFYERHLAMTWLKELETQPLDPTKVSEILRTTEPM